MRLKRKKLLNLLSLSAICLLFLVGCISQTKVDDLLRDADYSLHEGKYEEAREIYKEILEKDSDNRDALYGLKDLEKACNNRDSGLMDNLCTNIAAAIFLPDNNANVVPFGDYSLEEYLNLAGNKVKDEVYSGFGVSSAQEISDKLLSVDQNGNPIKGTEIRVGYYDRNSWSVYIPGSYQIEHEGVIYGGVRPQ